MKAVKKRERSDPCKLTGPDCFTYVFVSLAIIINCRLYTSILSEQTQVTLQMTVNLADLVSRFLISLALLEGPKGFFFPLAPNPLSGARHDGIKMDFVHGSIYSEPRHWMEVSGLRHVPAALPSKKEPGVHRIGD